MSEEPAPDEATRLVRSPEQPLDEATRAVAPDAAQVDEATRMVRPRDGATGVPPDADPVDEATRVVRPPEQPVGGATRVAPDVDPVDGATRMVRPRAGSADGAPAVPLDAVRPPEQPVDEATRVVRAGGASGAGAPEGLTRSAARRASPRVSPDAAEPGAGPLPEDATRAVPGRPEPVEEATRLTRRRRRAAPRDESTHLVRGTTLPPSATDPSAVTAEPVTGGASVTAWDSEAEEWPTRVAPRVAPPPRPRQVEQVFPLDDEEPAPPPRVIQEVPSALRVMQWEGDPEVRVVDTEALRREGLSARRRQALVVISAIAGVILASGAGLAALAATL